MPEVCYRIPYPLIRGRRECRALDAPAASHAKIKKAYERSHHGHTGFTRHSPRNGFNGFLRALPGVRILGCHRRQRIKVCQSPVGMTRLRKFSTSNGCQDHTTSPSASASLVCSPDIAHGVDPALRLPCAPGAISVHRIPPRVRDDREPPLWGGGTANAYY
jgi:hypothetical protein